MGILGKITKYTSFVGGCLITAVGVIHFINSLHEWCKEDDFFPTGEFAGEQVKTCVGPWLRWETNDSKFTSDINQGSLSSLGGTSTAGGWRDVFTFVPDKFLDLWTPLLLGLLTVATHSHALRIHVISLNFARMTVWHLIIACFGGFGYTGQLGIIAGMIAVVGGILCALSSVLDHEEGVTIDFAIRKDGSVPSNVSAEDQQSA